MSSHDQPADCWWRRPNRFKRILADGLPATAMWVTVPWPSIMEILGNRGLDAAFVDMEHTSFGLDLAQALFTSAQLAGVTPLVRPSEVTPAKVSRLLDAGAEGIVFPHIDDRAEAAEARRMLAYPPAGSRGWGGSHTRRAMWDGPTASAAMAASEGEDRGVFSADYVERATNELVAIFSIESVRGVENVDEILDAGRPDAVSFGWGDFSVEVGFDAARCRDALRKVDSACQARGIGVAVPPGDIPERYYPGCYVMAGIDSLILSQALGDALVHARTELASAPTP